MQHIHFHQSSRPIVVLGEDDPEMRQIRRFADAVGVVVFDVGMRPGGQPAAQPIVDAITTADADSIAFVEIPEEVVSAVLQSLGMVWQEETDLRLVRLSAVTHDANWHRTRSVYRIDHHESGYGGTIPAAGAFEASSLGQFVAWMAAVLAGGHSLLSRLGWEEDDTGFAGELMCQNCSVSVLQFCAEGQWVRLGDRPRLPLTAPRWRVYDGERAYLVPEEFVILGALDHAAAAALVGDAVGRPGHLQSFSAARATEVYAQHYGPVYEPSLTPEQYLALAREVETEMLDTGRHAKPMDAYVVVVDFTDLPPQYEQGASGEVYPLRALPFGAMLAGFPYAAVMRRADGQYELRLGGFRSDEFLQATFTALAPFLLPEGTPRPNNPYLFLNRGLGGGTLTNEAVALVQSGRRLLAT